MRQYKVVLIAVALLIGTLASSASAQGMRQGGGMMRMSPEDRAAMLKDSLGLDQTQVDSVISIFKEMNAKREAMMNSDDDRDARREAMMSLMSQTDEKIEALLTSDQKAKYEAMKQERASRFRQRQN
ncbi:MAG TPA: hypothetical protein VMM58_03820 [Bacteroidota bacterium]|nr:hypothetical protein [Bacteroidota bacterium]